MSDCLFCVTRQVSDIKSSSKIRAKINLIQNNTVNIKGIAKLDPNKMRQPALIRVNVASIGKIRSKANLSENVIALKTSDNGNIKSLLKFTTSAIRSRVSAKPTFTNKNVDKFSGHLNKILSIDNYVPVHKLYPKRDILTSLNNSYFVDKYSSSGSLYQSIDEGIFTGNYQQSFKVSNLISDDNQSYIQPSSVFTSGTFRYKCEVTRPYHHPKESFLFIRASAPTSNYASNVPPEYRIHNIRLEDPSGNLIIKYKDISLRGDSDYRSSNLNYSTYISEPEINNANLHTWDENYPIMTEPSGYSLSMDFDVVCLDDPFSEGFDLGYEERVCELKFVNSSSNDYLSLDGSPLSTNTQGYTLNPTNSLRISAIEICNSGDLCNICQVSGIKRDNRLSFYLDVGVTGQRLVRNILPTQLSTSYEDADIYPSITSTWVSSPDGFGITSDNTSVSGSNVLLSKLQTTDLSNFITLIGNNPALDSGRLTLKFSHKPPTSVSTLSDGEFGFGDNSFNSAEWQTLEQTDHLFEVDSVELKIIAKKAVGTRDYVIDVVGYSDDKLLNVTPKVGAFLQNKHEIYYLGDEKTNYVVSNNNDLIFIDQNESIGNVPLVSGFKNTNDLAISSESLSEKDQYYEGYLTSVDAGDHYKLSTLPVISSTTFKEYVIPLEIYKDKVDIGLPKDRSFSSYFENLYIDLYPIPSGASIASVQLIVNYKPSNGMFLHTVGTPNSKELALKDILLLPTGRTNNNDISINSSIDNGPLSIISGIPHGYSEATTLKTNYARRWRGVDGNIVNGPYDPNEFGFSFYNPPLDNPFLYGYYNLNNASGNWIVSDDFSSSGYYSGSNKILKNIGWRFNDTQLFANNKNHTTLDWTTETDQLFGQISDSFDSALLLGSGNGTITFNNFNLANGLSLFLRFTPHPTYDSKIGLEDFIPTLLYQQGGLGLVLYLDNRSNTLSVYTEYGYNYNSDLLSLEDVQFPLSVLMTYDSDLSYLRIYHRNEIKNIDDLIFESQIQPPSLNENILIGSNEYLPFYIHEIGISSSGNIVHSNPDRLLKQTTASSFLDGHGHSFSALAYNKYKLHNYIDDNTSLWKIGDFNVCSFSADFDRLTKRDGKDYIVHHLRHSGSGYSQLCNLPLPSNIITSDLAYHTQIENDFLRFNLQDIPDVNPEFYSIHPRISKSTPRGYDFKERAIVVDTVIEHETLDNIVWSDGKIGPKLIVSLYTKNQDPADRPSKVNWGLVNRSIHYIKPSGCYQKLSSTFNYNNLIDRSEPWADFDLDNVISEFDHKYYSTDINDMFLQYDLAYPSGSPFDSKIKIHSANVRLEDTLTYFGNRDSSVNLYSSGDKISLTDINLYTYGRDVIYAGLDLAISGEAWPTNNASINFCVSGVYGIPSSQFSLFVKNSGVLSSMGPDLVVSGGPPREEQSMALVMIDNTSIYNVRSIMPLIVSSRGLLDLNSSLNISIADGLASFRQIYSTGKFNLFTQNQQIISSDINNNFNLYINTDLDYESLDSAFSLFTINYPAYNQSLNQQASITWDENNTGKSIDTFDNDKAFLEANDEIRGVDLLCYGQCDTEKQCKEQPIYIHDSYWYNDDTCIEGGIFRVKNTYTNLEVSGFKTPIGYSGHFYGIRKYDGLIPNAPYNVTITSQTGSNKVIDLPRQFIETNYGSNDIINYSGVKLTSTTRQSGNQFGKSIAGKKDLIAIGSPHSSVSYSEYNSSGDLISIELQDAGKVFLYRRNPRPSEINWPENNEKSDWNIETVLTLPSGLLKDYPTRVKRNNIGGIPVPADVIESFWNVGQEGRQFGYSLDLGINNNIKSFQEDRKEVVVVGAPYAKWSREFEELQTSGVSVGLLIFTDEFSPTIQNPNNPKETLSANNVWQAIQNKDLVFKYFSDPPIKFNVKVIICQPIASTSNRVLLDFPEPRPPFITKTVIPRNQGIVDESDTLAVFSGIKSSFEQAFPYDNTKIHNNIPVMLGVYVDHSRSLGRQAIQQGLDRFLDYYKNYSFASGLRDFYNVQSSGEIYEYFPQFGQTENWINLSITALDNLLDTGRLVADNQVRFFSSNIGSDAFNVNLAEFNYAPPSGGRVYVFEKESGVWNLIQDLEPQTVSYDTNDVFGHAVAISEDTNVIAVGSPYINEACKIYQHSKEEKQRLYDSLYSWLAYKNSFYGGLVQRYSSLVSDYNSWVSLYGNSYANQILYSKLTPTEKFEARKHLNIKEYQNVFTYRYSDIPHVGTWDFIPKTFAPSSRLGYSVAVNDDGSTVAFGAPTDSFNAFDDFNVYYKNDGYEDPLNIDNINGPIKSSWRSNVNAGAVRLFEARDYYPHNRVVEFRKFGNLQENNILDSGHFNYLSTIFQDKNFIKTDFEDVEIPQDAGLAFIITPEIDALSDEVVENIISWLSLGDRNLVLVGNDPVWEENGAYKTSNDLINRLLSRLNSKVRLYPARNNYESLPSGGSIVIPSFIPSRSTPSYIRPAQLSTAYGVADIRMHFPGYQKYMPCLATSANTKCELPLVHGGDLRAQWLDSCPDFNCGFKITSYPVNWAFVFKTFDPDCCKLVLDALNEDRFDLPNQEPVPLLAASETVFSTRIIPATPARYTQVPIYEQRISYSSSTYYEFDEENINNSPSFVLGSSSTSGVTYESNINSVAGGDIFYKPPSFENRDPIIQAKAFPVSETLYGSELVSQISRYCVEQTVGSSKVIAIAGTKTESQRALMSGAGDENINFYANLVSKDRYGNARIAQLGGWTGRNSFVAADSESILYEVFRNSGNDVDENVDGISVMYDVCWIANPLNLPSDYELFELKSWINSGNKKLIITHDSSLTQMLLVNELLKLLNTNISSVYLKVREEYPIVNNSLQFNQNSFVSNGFGVFPIYNFSFGVTFIPFSYHENIMDICYANVLLYDTKLITDGYWKLNSGIDKVTFPAVAGSGYKIFIQTVSENIYENQRLDFYVKNGSEQPSLPYPNNYTGNISIDGYTLKEISTSRSASNYTTNKIQTISFNIQVPENKNSIELYVNSLNYRINASDHIPKTTRLLSVSGVLLPIKQITVQSGRPYPELVGYRTEKVEDARPEIVITDYSQRQISTLNDKYCYNTKSEVSDIEVAGGDNDTTAISSNNICHTLGFDNQFIADGPVVASQEIESISSFNAGVARSRITVISDSSLVQGRFMTDEFGRMNANTVSFIRSLYPETSFPSNVAGKQYSEFTKIVAPERGSPQKYFALIGNGGSINRFGSGGSAGSLTQFDHKESLYDPKYVKRSELPWPASAPKEYVDIIKSEEIDKFRMNQTSYGATAKFSGIIEGKMYGDIGIEGGMPAIMKDTGSDYLDFDRFPSGYPGDLFGYSVSLHKNKLVVGAPFASFSDNEIHPWEFYLTPSGLSTIKLSYNGGAGSVYVFEKTFKGSGLRNTVKPWEFTQKLRPDSINIGQDLISNSGSNSYSKLGPNSYSNIYLAQNSFITDQFGYDVSIDSDIIAVGSPGHDFDNTIYSSGGAYIRKCFNDEFNIQTRNVFDLGNSGVRDSIGSGTCVLNNGAIFTFENKIVDWSNRKQSWTLIEKVVPQGINSREQGIPSGNENDYFGRSVYVHRANRTDSDYIILGGSENHKYSSNGTSPLTQAGSVYVNDIMLRNMAPALPNSNAYIDAKVFGELLTENDPAVRIITSNNNYNNQLISNSGIVYSDKNGSIFLEASGQDPSLNGFIQHRPFIVSIDGLYVYGIRNSGDLPLFIDGTVKKQENMDLFVNATTGNVYNSIGMHTSSIVDLGSGIVNFYLDCPAPTQIFESGLALTMASGVGLGTDKLNLRIRGY